MQADRCFACTGCPHAPRRGIGVRTRQRHLAAVRGACRACCAPRKRDCGLICAPRKWLCRPTDALPVLVVRTPPGGALACAPGSGTLPPLCVIERREERGCRGAPCRGVVKAGARSPRPCDGEGAGIFPQKSGKMRKAYAVRRVSRLLISSLPQSQADCFSALPKNSLYSRRHGPGGGGRSAPAGVPGQSPGPPEAETTRTCGRSRRRCDRRNRDCCSAPP